MSSPARVPRVSGLSAAACPCQPAAGSVSGRGRTVAGMTPTTTPTTADAIVARGLIKRFGATTAVDGVDLTIAAGTVLGLLGPNGAGKTTIVSILATLIIPDDGQAACTATTSSPRRTRSASSSG